METWFAGVKLCQLSLLYFTNKAARTIDLVSIHPLYEVFIIQEFHWMKSGAAVLAVPSRPLTKSFHKYMSYTMCLFHRYTIMHYSYYRNTIPFCYFVLPNILYIIQRVVQMSMREKWELQIIGIPNMDIYPLPFSSPFHFK